MRKRGRTNILVKSFKKLNIFANNKDPQSEFGEWFDIKHVVVNTLGGVLEQCEDWTSDDRQIRHGTYSSGLLTLTTTTTFHDMLGYNMS